MSEVDYSLTDFGKYSAAVVLFVDICGYLLNCLLLFVMLRHRKTLLKISTDYLFLYLIVIQILWSAFGLISTTVVIINGGFNGPIGYAICQFSGFGSSALPGLSTTGQVVIALDRYWRIINGIQFTKKKIIPMIVSSYFFILGIPIVQLTLMERKFEPVEDRSFCFLPLVVRDDPKQLLISILPFVAFIPLTMMLHYIYYSVYQKCIRVRKQTSSISRSSNIETSAIKKSKSEKEKEMEKLNRFSERIVYWRCIYILVVFLCSYLCVYLCCFAKLIFSIYLPDYMMGISTLISIGGIVIGTPLVMIGTQKEFLNLVSATVLDLINWRKY